MYQKGIIPVFILMVLVVIALVGGTGYYFYTTRVKSNNVPNISLGSRLKAASQSSSIAPTHPNQMVGWNTYTNQNFGYEVQYPTGWVVSPVGLDENDTNQAVVIAASPIKATDINTDTLVPDKSVYIEVVPVPIQYTFEQWWNDHKQHFGITIAGTDTPDYSKITFPRDKITLDATDTATGRLEWETIIIWKDNYTYMISAKNLAGVWNDKPFGDIVSSFTPKPNQDQLGWHTYNSSEGFAIDVPNLVTVSQNKEGSINVSSGLNGLLYDHFGAGIALDISQIPNPNHLSVPEWYRQALVNGTVGTGSPGQITPEEAALLSSGKSITGLSKFGVLVPATFGNYAGFTTSVFGGDQGIAVDYIANGNTIFSFRYSNDNPNISDTPWESLVEQKIISSVHFNN